MLKKCPRILVTYRLGWEANGLERMNLPKSFELMAYTGEVETAALAGGWTVRHLSPMESGPRPWFQRAALTGKASSPPLFEMMEVLGRDESSIRLKAYAS